MAHQRKGRKVLNHDIINVTDLDHFDDFEEFTVPHGISQTASRNTSQTVSPDTNHGVSRDQSYNKHRKETNHVNGTSKTGYKDPLSHRNYQDPLQKITLKDPFMQKSKILSGASNESSSILLKQGSEVKHNSNQRDLARQTVQQSSVLSTQNNLRQMKTLPSREVSTTPLSANKPVTSFHITKHYNSTPKYNKNQKGFSRDEKDLFVDDIEDF